LPRCSGSGFFFACALGFAVRSSSSSASFASFAAFAAAPRVVRVGAPSAVAVAAFAAVVASRGVRSGGAAALALPVLRRAFVVARAGGLSAGRLAVLARAGRRVAALAPVVAPVAVVDPVAAGMAALSARGRLGVGFVPASLALGRAGVVPSSRFLPCGRGVLSAVVPDARGVRVVVGGASFLCLFSGLGGASSASSVGLSAALVDLLGSPVSLVGAPGSSGSVLGGFFCGVLAA